MLGGDVRFLVVAFAGVNVLKINRKKHKTSDLLKMVLRNTIMSTVETENKRGENDIENQTNKWKD